MTVFLTAWAVFGVPELRNIQEKEATDRKTHWRVTRAALADGKWGWKQLRQYWEVEQKIEIMSSRRRGSWTAWQTWRSSTSALFSPATWRRLWWPMLPEPAAIV